MRGSATGTAAALWALAAGCAGGAGVPADGGFEPLPPAVVAPAAATPTEVTAPIQAGIERHIAEQVRLGSGRFALPFGERTLQLELVRVHTEYLARLGPRRFFACVDLADVTGDVYDVDFFLEGEPAAMVVTETTVHKLNGKPYYAWQQATDGTWHRVPAESASDRELGVVTGRDAFTFRYRVELPALGAPARMWLPYPESDAFQTVTVEAIDAPVPHRVLTDRAHGNRVLFLELAPAHGGATVEMRFRVERSEVAAHAAGDADDPRQHLQPERLVPEDPRFAAIAAEVVTGKPSDLMRARALYDHVIDTMRYMRYGPGWGQGDAAYACDAQSGNCTDFHAYFIALARSAGIPARFAIGAAIPSERDEGGVAGYHCWAEFHADGRWWPVDVSEADKYTRLATYYFGHHPANRIEFSRGRDLVVEPGPASGPINFLAYPVLEVGGKPVRAKVAFSFQRLAPAGG